MIDFLLNKHVIVQSMKKNKRGCLFVHACDVIVQHKAYFLIQLNADFPLSLCLLIPMLALFAYPDADYPDADPD